MFCVQAEAGIRGYVRVRGLGDVYKGRPLPSAGKKVKDIAAGAVVFAATFAVLVGLILFVPKLWPLITAWL